MKTFHDMELSAPLLKTLDALNFTHPTPIQLQTLPSSLAGKDILGSAQTGTGKTLAFSIPLVENLLKNPKGMALILTPTRELAQQVAATIRQLVSSNLPIKMALLIGGEPIGKQFHQLKLNPRIIVGTPGRVIDHMERKTLKKANFSFLVLDETDRMFDMGFGIQLEQIISQIPTERQTLMFSATFPAKIEKLAATYMIEPARFFTEEKITISDKLTQETIHVKEGDKYDQLVTQLNNREGSVIVFVKTKINADRLATQLTKENHSASAIHGDLRQHKRERVMAAFRQGRYRIMVATDIAARGLDVPHVQHVINYDLPQASEDFIHRIGRTARNGAEGSAITFVSTRDRRLWDDIQRLINPDMPRSNDRGSSDRKVSNRNSSSPSKGGRFSRGKSGPSKFGEKSDRRFGERSGGRSEGKSGGRFEGKSENRFGDSFATKRPSDRFGNKSEGNGEKKSFEKSFSDRKPFERTFADKKPFDKGFSEKKPFEKKSSDKSFFDKKPFDKKGGDRSFSRPSSNKRGRA